MNERQKDRFKHFLDLEVVYPEGPRSCAYCKRSLLPDTLPIEMEYRTEDARYVYRFCQQDHVERGWPHDEDPTDDAEVEG